MPTPAFSAGVPVRAVTCTFTVHQPGVLYCYLVDEEHSHSEGGGIVSWILQVEGAGDWPRPVPVRCDLPEGRYGIRAFLDLNGNGKLDRGLLRPVEPWGMSWTAGPRTGIPRFEDIAFVLGGGGATLAVDVR